MRYAVDCEFDGHEGPLISIAVVTSNGSGFYGTTYHEPVDHWVITNVMPILDKEVPHHKLWSSAGSIEGVRRGLKSYLGTDEHPTFMSDSPVDIMRVCQLLSTGDDGNWAPSNFAKMNFEVHNVDCWPCSLNPSLQHNAYWDAMALWEKLYGTS